MSEDVIRRYNGARPIQAPAQLLADAIHEIEVLREENARLLEALKPFAARLDELEKMKASKYACATPVEIEHLRAARAAIREKRSFATEGGKE